MLLDYVLQSVFLSALQPMVLVVRSMSQGLPPEVLNVRSVPVYLVESVATLSYNREHHATLSHNRERHATLSHNRERPATLSHNRKRPLVVALGLTVSCHTASILLFGLP